MEDIEVMVIQPEPTLEPWNLMNEDQQRNWFREHWIVLIHHDEHDQEQWEELRYDGRKTKAMWWKDGF